MNKAFFALGISGVVSANEVLKRDRMCKFQGRGIIGRPLALQANYVFEARFTEVVPR